MKTMGVRRIELAQPHRESFDVNHDWDSVRRGDVPEIRGTVPVREDQPVEGSPEIAGTKGSAALCTEQLPALFGRWAQAVTIA